MAANMNQTHYLKTWPEFFEASQKGLKNFEVRKNDRQFEVGDILILQEFFRQPGTMGEGGNLTGRALARTVTYIFRGPLFGLEDGYIVMGVK